MVRAGRRPRGSRPRGRRAAGLVRPDRLALFLLLWLAQAQRTLDLAGDVHRAELRPAHRAELRALEVLGGQRLVVQLACARGVERQPELLVPVERIARA